MKMNSKNSPLPQKKKYISYLSPSYGHSLFDTSCFCFTIQVESFAWKWWQIYGSLFFLPGYDINTCGYERVANNIDIEHCYLSTSTLLILDNYLDNHRYHHNFYFLHQGWEVVVELDGADG